MFEVFMDAINDTLKMVPFLLIIYIGIEIVEHKWGAKIIRGVQKAGVAGPAIGAVSGSLPQCGFSVIGTTLYTQRLVTIGTLLAIYLSTSDEALPVILSQPDKAAIIVPLLLTKILIAVVAGYSIDFVFKKKNKETLAHIQAYTNGKDDKAHHHEGVIKNTEACCGHKPNSKNGKFDFKAILLHPTIHTAKIFAFIFIITILINALIFVIGDDAFKAIFAGNVYLQPFIAALVGLIPNCASSVAITELYLEGAITYGALIAGLLAAGGIGLIVLLKEDKDRKDVFLIIGLLFGISVAVGLAIQFLGFSPSI